MADGGAFDAMKSDVSAVLVFRKWQRKARAAKGNVQEVKDPEEVLGPERAAKAAEILDGMNEVLREEDADTVGGAEDKDAAGLERNKDMSFLACLCDDSLMDEVEGEHDAVVKFDSDGDGVLESMSARRFTKLEEIFKSMDANGDEVIDQDEMVNIVSKNKKLRTFLGLERKSTAQVIEYFKSVAQGDGKLSLSEFVGLFLGHSVDDFWSSLKLAGFSDEGKGAGSGKKRKGLLGFLPFGKKK